MILLGKTMRLANSGNYKAGYLVGERSTTVTIETDTLNGASSKNARCQNTHAGLKSWSVRGEVVFSTESFNRFCNWMANNDAEPIFVFSCQHEEMTFYVSGKVIITRMSISCGLHDTIKISYDAKGAGEATIETPTLS